MKSKMILNVTATEYQGRTESGRSHPMLCVCENDNGEEVFAYVKFAGFHEDFQIDHLVGEAVANLFALDIGLPAATPCLVKIETDFVSQLPLDDQGIQLRAALAGAPLLAFGSVKLDPIRRWQNTDFVPKAQRRDAKFLYLFDTIVENTDRGLKNPNLLMSGLNFRVIDFGHCFQRCHVGNPYDFGKKPWEKGGISNHFAGDMQHIMYENVRQIDEETLQEFTNALGGLTDDKIEGYLAQVPPEWGQDTACKIVNYLLEARDHASQFADQARRVLR
jgi:hypothetical protein